MKRPTTTHNQNAPSSRLRSITRRAAHVAAVIEYYAPTFVLALVWAIQILVVLGVLFELATK